MRNKSQSTNPPTEVLYLTQAVPAQEQEMRDLCASIDCSLKDIEWRQNPKDGRWMCLLEFACIDQSLLAMGLLQNVALSNNKEIKLSFTRSKISRSAGKKHRMEESPLLIDS